MLGRVQRRKKKTHYRKQRTIPNDRSSQGRGMCRMSADFVRMVFDDLTRSLDVSIGYIVEASPR